MIGLRRGPKEVDWQTELAGRSAATGTQLDVARAPARELPGLRQIKKHLWKLLAPLAFAASLSWLIFGGKHHTSVTAVLGLVNVCLLPLQLTAARRRKREQEMAHEPTDEERVQWELRTAAHDLHWFLLKPPDRATYDRWLNTAQTHLERVSPDVAARWAQPDRGRDAAAPTVSAAELEARRKRMLELYAEVAPLDKLESLTSTLTPVGGLSENQVPTRLSDAATA